MEPEAITGMTIDETIIWVEIGVERKKDVPYLEEMTEAVVDQ